MAGIDKEVAKLLLPSRFKGDTTIEATRFLNQYKTYLAYNTNLTTVRHQVLVAIGLFDDEAREWGVPIIAEYAANTTTPYANIGAFYTAFTARFGNIDDAAAAQVELNKVCAARLRDTRTAAELSAAFKGPAQRSGYGPIELRDKYLSAIPSRVYRKIEIETFADWTAAEKRVLEVEQMMDISRARRPETFTFGRGKGGGSQRGRGNSQSVSAGTTGDRQFTGLCYGCGLEGHRRVDCPNGFKDYTGKGKGKVAKAAATGNTPVASSTTPTPTTSSAVVVKSVPGNLDSLIAQIAALTKAVSARDEELKQLRALRESEGF